MGSNRLKAESAGRRMKVGGVFLEGCERLWKRKELSDHDESETDGFSVVRGVRGCNRHLQRVDMGEVRGDGVSTAQDHCE